MIIDCISDLHGHYPQLEGGDLLIVAGDLTETPSLRELDYFNDWIREQSYIKIIIIGGNHDTFFEKGVFNVDDPRDGTVFVDPFVEYLCDSSTAFEYEEDDIELEISGIHPTVTKELKIWGSPWTKTIKGINPHCKAFTVDTEEELAEKWALIPDDVDILITHSPPFYCLDDAERWHGMVAHLGSIALSDTLKRLSKLKLHVFGHIHEGYGHLEYREDEDFIQHSHFVNASHVNERYEPVHKPIRIEI